MRLFDFCFLSVSIILFTLPHSYKIVFYARLDKETDTKLTSLEAVLFYKILSSIGKNHKRCLC